MDNNLYLETLNFIFKWESGRRISNQEKTYENILSCLEDGIKNNRPEAQKINRWFSEKMNENRFENISEFFSFSEMLFEQDIEVGDSFLDRLELLDTKLSDKLKDFLFSDQIKDDIDVKKIDYEGDEKLVTLYTNKDNKRKFKFNKLLSYLGYKDSLKGYEQESISNVFKNIELSKNLKLVDGEKLREAYLEDNYDLEENKYGDLSASCMRHEESQDFLDIYVKNPKRVSCLVLYNDEGLIRGRALIWNLDDGRKYMDRIYANDPSEKSHFFNYAIQNNIIRDLKEKRVTISLDHAYTEFLPYMDTFKFFNTQDGILSNVKSSPYELILNQDDGTATFDAAYSHYLETDIPRELAIKIRYDGDIDNVLKDTVGVVEIDYSSEKFEEFPQRTVSEEAVEIGYGRDALFLFKDDEEVYTYSDHRDEYFFNLGYIHQEILNKSHRHKILDKLNPELVGEYVGDEFYRLEDISKYFDLEENDFKIILDEEIEGRTLCLKLTDEQALSMGFKTYDFPEECVENFEDFKLKRMDLDINNLPIFKSEYNIGFKSDENKNPIFYKK